MFKLLLVFLYLFISLDAREFKVASYNVENFFDLKKQGTEYKEYIPYTKYWNQTSYDIKLKNIVKTINHLDSEIVALQEIESNIALKSLLEKLPQYRYSKFIKNHTSSIGVALISKFAIVKTVKIKVDKYDKYARDILKATINIDNKSLIIYVNHWRSKRASESKRIVYATALKNDIESLYSNEDYIILGDLNSNYNEYQTFKYDKKLNDTYGITAINQILNTTMEENFVRKENIFDFKRVVHYNLWLELKKQNRFSSIFKGENNTPDNILISKGLFDNKNISYVENSFNVFKPSYLYKKHKIIRWNRGKKRGYSDHLPIYATFSTSLQLKSIKREKKRLDEVVTISDLYNIEQINKPTKLHNIVVIFKTNKIAIIKQKNNRAIMVYNPPKQFILGKSYDIVIDKIDQYNGLKEIKIVSYIKKIPSDIKYKSLYLDGSGFDLFEDKYQNEMITNLKGSYKKGYLYYYNNSKLIKIKLYFKNKKDKPTKKNITIKAGHIGIYRSKKQIVIYNKEDYN
ncbi:MAG: endonuclease/exonuclease/phosphatase family protein [Campylobacterota bacterium]|nr:endonuclease/exonuclease/phosphatase family protein [Campylobacterota bacterium]